MADCAQNCVNPNWKFFKKMWILWQTVYKITFLFACFISLLLGTNCRMWNNFEKSDCHISKRLFSTLENVVWNNTREKYSEFDTSRDICKLLHLKLKFKDLLDWLNDHHKIHFGFSQQDCSVFREWPTYFHSACLPAFIADVLWQGGKIMGIFGAET